MRAGPISPDFSITRIASTTVTAQIADLGFSYRFIVTLQASGEKISIPSTSGQRLTENNITIDSLYPFTTYKIELQARSDREPWSYPASREVKTREEGTHAVNTITLDPEIVLFPISSLLSCLLTFTRFMAQLHLYINFPSIYSPCENFT